jgi:hypothetical protein
MASDTAPLYSILWRLTRRTMTCHARRFATESRHSDVIHTAAGRIRHDASLYLGMRVTMVLHDLGAQVSRMELFALETPVGVLARPTQRGRNAGAPVVPIVAVVGLGGARCDGRIGGRTNCVGRGRCGRGTHVGALNE